MSTPSVHWRCIPPGIGSQSIAQGNKDVHPIEFGKPIERELVGGQVHSYQITLAAGQFLHVVVDQRGIDVVVTLFGPDGTKLAEVDSPNGAQGPEPVSIVAEVAGNYRLAVHSLEKDAAAGRYEVKIAELRLVTAQDRSRLAAQQSFAEGKQLRGRGTAASLQQAIGKYQDAVKLFRDARDRAGEAEALYQIGVVFDLLGEKPKALDSLGQALPIWREVNSRTGEADTLNVIGMVYDSMGETQKALDYYNQALSLWPAIGNPQGEASTLTNIGAAYYSIGENQKALEFYNRALPLRRAARDRRGEASTLTNIGNVYHSMGETQVALNYNGQALSIWREVDDLRGVAITLNNLGMMYNLLGETQKALDHLNQSLLLRRAVGDRTGEAVTLNNIGITYSSLGEKQRTLDYYNQSLALRRAVSDRPGEANMLNNIGAVYFEIGKQQKAFDYYQQSLPLWRAVRSRRGEASTLSNIGRVYEAMGEKQRSLSHYTQALALWHAVEDRRGEALALQNLARLHELMGEPQKALDYYSQSLAFSRAVEDRQNEAAVLHGMARIELDRNNFSEARQYLETALSLTESLRAKVASQELRATYFGAVRSYYDSYIALLMRLHQQRPAEGHDAAALQVSERARARSLLETLVEARADIRQGVAPSLLEREKSLQQLITGKADRQIRLLNRKHTQEQAEAAAKELEALTAERQQVEAQIRSASPRYAALTQPQPLPLAEIQRLLDPDTLLLEYALGEERSFLFAVTPKGLESFELPKRKEIEKLSRRVYDLLTEPTRQPQNETAAQQQARLRQAEAAYPEAAAALSRVLLAPAAARLGAKRLVIVSDGWLHHIPFAALPEPQNGRTGNKRTRSQGAKGNPQSFTPLIVKHEIVHLPSASTLAVLRHELEGRGAAPKTVALLADPVFEVTDDRVKLSTASAQGAATRQDQATREVSLDQLSNNRVLRETFNPGAPIPRLPYTKREAEAIEALAPAAQRKIVMGFEVNYQTATSPELGQYRIVHFSTHGLLNSEHPELSAILLSLVDEQGRPQERGLLRLGEVYNLKLPADLVVLSACQTALGKDVRGEGLIGLTRGFMYAGASRVMASLWKVDDEATAELMRHFYQGLLGPKALRPAEALRRAQLAMWQSRKWRAPFYWGAFTLQGEWR